MGKPSAPREYADASETASSFPAETLVRALALAFTLAPLGANLLSRLLLRSASLRAASTLNASACSRSHASVSSAPAARRWFASTRFRCASSASASVDMRRVSPSRRAMW